MKYAGEAGIPRDTAWSQLTEAQHEWVIEGSPNWNGKWNQQWYGVKRFFGYLESKAYKMHIRVLLVEVPQLHAVPGVRRRAPQARGAALAPRHEGRRRRGDARRRSASCRSARSWSREQLEAMPGLTVHDLMMLPIDRIRGFFDRLSLPSGLLDEALKLLLDEVRTRLRYLCDVGIGYLTLDRQSRTLSGGEVQRINLTTALGTSLVNTLFVLDEPSIGLHPRDMSRIVEAMHRLRDAGNTLVVVEHDPAVMLAADRLIDMGPGPGERGGRDRLRRHARGDQERRHADRRLPRRAEARRHGPQAPGRRLDAAPHRQRRARPQPEERHGRVPAPPPRLRHRRLRARARAR